MNHYELLDLHTYLAENDPFQGHAPCWIKLRSQLQCDFCGKIYDPLELTGVPDWLMYCSPKCYQAGTGEKPCQTCGKYPCHGCECA
jgi:hypothetical protein